MGDWIGDVLTKNFLQDKFPEDDRIRVGKLTRIGPPKNEGWFYYSPDGHLIGPFEYEEEREIAIKKYYKES